MLSKAMYPSYFSRAELISVRRRALRRGVWFRVLGRVERGVIDLTIRCVETIRSPTLAGVIRRVLNKLADAMRGRVERLMGTVGRPLAARLSEVAQAWGNASAREWAFDLGLIRYLTIKDERWPLLQVIALSRDQIIGAVILVLSLLEMAAYGWLVYFYPLIVVQVTAFLAVATVSAILAWIGYVMATTPPPSPLEEITAEGEERGGEAKGRKSSRPAHD